MVAIEIPLLSTPIPISIFPSPKVNSKFFITPFIALPSAIKVTERRAPPFKGLAVRLIHCGNSSPVAYTLFALSPVCNLVIGEVSILLEEERVK